MELEKQKSTRAVNGPRDEDSLPSSDQVYATDSHDQEDVEPASDDDHGDDLQQTKTNASISEGLSPFREFIFVSLICLAQFTTQVALGQTLSILHVIGDDFGLTNPGDLSWLIAGYSLTVGTFILVAGRFGDIFGYKKMLIIGWAWFSLWSMVAGLAVYSNYVLFIFARVLQGIGPSIALPNGLAILGASYHPGPKKDMVFALFGATAPGGSIVGAVFAGIFALAWWPWTFWSFSIVLAIMAVTGYFFIPAPPPKASLDGKKRSLRDTLVMLDPLGSISGVTALVLFNFAWNQSGVTGWNEPYVYICLTLGVLIAPIFFYVELRVASEPLIPFRALNADVAFVLACVACGWGCFGVFIYYIWNFAELLKDASPLHASAWICPVAVSGAIASLMTGFLLSRLRPAWVMTISLAAFTTGTVLIATAPIGQSYWAQFFVCTLIIPFGMDMSFPASTLILSNAFPKEHQGVAASLVNTVVNYSISLALGMAGTVEGNVNDGGTTPAELLKGYRGAWYFGIGLAGLGLFISIIFLAKSYIYPPKAEQDEK